MFDIIVIYSNYNRYKNTCMYKYKFKKKLPHVKKSRVIIALCWWTSTLNSFGRTHYHMIIIPGADFVKHVCTHFFDRSFCHSLKNIVMLHQVY